MTPKQLFALQIMLLAILCVTIFSLGHRTAVWFSPTNEAESIISNVSDSHEYIEDVYMCANYTTDAVLALRKKGYEAYFVSAYNEGEENGHAYVKLCRDYDVTYGLIPPEEFDHWSIIEVWDDGSKHGVYCPWMEEEEAWENWCTYTFELECECDYQKVITAVCGDK